MKTINTNHFTNAEFMTADEKRCVLNAWTRFLKSGLKFQRFTHPLYRHLINHCGFIAHYSRRGFFDEYFMDATSTKRFLDQYDRAKGCPGAECGSDYWLRGGNDVCAQYYDINTAMVDIVSAMRFAGSL